MLCARFAGSTGAFRYRLILGNLAERDGLHIMSAEHGEIPIGRCRDSLVQAPARVPTQEVSCFRDVKAQRRGLMWRVDVLIDTPFEATPSRRNELLHHGADWHGVGIDRTKIPATLKAFWVDVQSLREQQIAGERLKHVLPRTHGSRIADHGRPA